jgi:hypothetical protein
MEPIHKSVKFPDPSFTAYAFAQGACGNLTEF